MEDREEKANDQNQDCEAKNHNAAPENETSFCWRIDVACADTDADRRTGCPPPLFPELGKIYDDLRECWQSRAEVGEHCCKNGHDEEENRLDEAEKKKNIDKRTPKGFDRSFARQRWGIVWQGKLESEGTNDFYSIYNDEAAGFAALYCIAHVRFRSVSNHFTVSTA